MDSFYNRYRLASDIVYGQVTAIEKTKESLPIFKEFSSDENYRATFKIKQSWKGQKEGEIQFFYNAEKSSYWFWNSARVRTKSKHIYPVSLGKRFLLFLREEDGKKIAQTYFGAYPLFRENLWQKIPEVAAMNDLRSGKPMKEVLTRLGSEEVKEYEESLKEKQ